MKKLYFLLLSLIITSVSFGQDLVISGVIDGPLPGGFPKGVELYVVNNIADLSIYGLELAANGGASGGAPTYIFPADNYNAGDYIYIGRTDDTNGNDSAAAFLQYLGVTLNYLDIVVNHNGDDTIILYKNGGVEDSFGEIGVDGTGEVWESVDGWAYRKDGEGPNAVFTDTEWDFSGINALDGCDLGDDSGTNAGCASVFPVGTYSPIPPACSVVFGTESYTCSSNTLGDNNDGVIINIPYSNFNAGITSVTTSGSGSVGGDDPDSIADGIITISGLSEG